MRHLLDVTCLELLQNVLLSSNLTLNFVDNHTKSTFKQCKGTRPRAWLTHRIRTSYLSEIPYAHIYSPNAPETEQNKVEARSFTFVVSVSLAMTNGQFHHDIRVTAFSTEQINYTYSEDNLRYCCYWHTDSRKPKW